MPPIRKSMTKVDMCSTNIVCIYYIDSSMSGLHCKSSSKVCTCTRSPLYIPTNSVKIPACFQNPSNKSLFSITTAVIGFNREHLELLRCWGTPVRSVRSSKDLLVEVYICLAQPSHYMMDGTFAKRPHSCQLCQAEMRWRNIWPIINSFLSVFLVHW